MKPGDILVAAATENEIGALADASEIESDRVFPSGRRVLSGKLSGKPYRLLITGVGMVNTAQALAAEMERQKPDMVIQAGIGGAFEESGLRIGDVAVATREQYIHAGIAAEDAVPLTPLPFDLVEGVPSTREGIFEVDSRLARKAQAILSKSRLTDGRGIETGPFITVSTITGYREKAARLYEAYVPLIEAMEGAAAAHVALLYAVPFLEIRAVSNYCGCRDKAAWDLPLATQRAASACIRLIAGFDVTF